MIVHKGGAQTYCRLFETDKEVEHPVKRRGKDMVNGLFR